MIMVILIAVLGLVVVNAMKHSTWATSTVAATVPIAMLVGIYMTYLRPGRLLEGSILGVGLILLAVLGGRFVEDFSFGLFLMDAPHSRDLDHRLRLPRVGAADLAAAGAARLPLRVHQARHHPGARDRHRRLHPPTLMPPLTQFVNGTGPVFGGKVFPFAFITVACGAISGFHSLIARAPRPKC